MRQRSPSVSWSTAAAYGRHVTEDDLVKGLDALGGVSLPVGWDTVTVGEGWSDFRDPSAFPDERDPATDRWGRQHPAVDKFPSSHGSRGLREIAARVHERGLRFALRIRPGMPTLALRRHMTVYGSSARIADIVAGSRESMPERTELNHGHSATQRWYDSQVALYASWGVDEIAVVLAADDARYADLVAFREAVTRCGRPMRVSLVCGVSSLDAERARLGAVVDSWQIGPAPITSWADVVEHFVAADEVASTTGAPGELSFGEVLLGENSPLSLDEQRACSTLSAVLGSSLSVSSTAEALRGTARCALGNPDLAVIRTDGVTALRERIGQVHAWRIEAGRRSYAALLNLGDTYAPVTHALPALGLGSTSSLEDTWSRASFPGGRDRMDVILEPHSVRLLRADR